MILPIYIYGQPVLKKKGLDIDQNYDGLDTLLSNMYETMYNSDGIGLAGPQVGLEDRIFVIDLSPLADEEHPEYKDLKKALDKMTKEELNQTIIQTEACCQIK